VVHRFDREPMAGYVNPQDWLKPEGLEVLSQDGVLLNIAYLEVKAVCFVKDWDGPSPFQERRRFANRPKSEGLWVQAQFRDNDIQEGILVNDLAQGEPFGFLIVPPEAVANNQRIFLPRAALKALRVLGVVGGPGKRRGKPQPAEEQIGLFE
jgi:hypothetical protein